MRGENVLLVPTLKLPSPPRRALLRPAGGGAARELAVVRGGDGGFEGQLSPPLAARLGAAAELARCDVEMRPMRLIDLARHGQGGLLATSAVLLALLAGLSVAVAGLATTRLPLGWAILVLALGVLAVSAKALVDYRSLTGP